MDKKQYKLLKKISKVNTFDYSDFDDENKEVIVYFAKKNYVVYAADENDRKKHLCQITPNGRSALYEWKTSQRHWFIPVVISIFAAIGGYRSEIYQIVQALMKLWKMLTENSGIS